MMTTLLIATVALPVCAVVLAIWRPRLGPWLAVATPLPGLALAILATTEFQVHVPALLLGAIFGVDGPGRLLLGLSASLWLAAGVFAGGYHKSDPNAGRMWAWWLTTQALNLGLILCQDAVSFMAFYAALGLVSWGVITIERTPQAYRAGRVYIVLALAGEFLLFIGVVWLAQYAAGFSLADMRHAWSDRVPAAVPLFIILAFGVKAALLPLHLWLPLAHPVAPVPSSAILSAVLVKTGVLGWWRFMGTCVELPGDPSSWWIPLGLAGAAGAALYGTLQRDPKTVLAYSTISQLGLISVLFASLLGQHAELAVTLPALGFFLWHHGLSKAALFLGVGIMKSDQPTRRRLWLWAALILPAIALAGAPYTSGLAAKQVVKLAATGAGDWAPLLKIVLPLTGATTALLLARFLWLVYPHDHRHEGDAHHPHPLAPGMLIGWIAILIGIIALPVVGVYGIGAGAFKISYVWSSLWPILVGTAVAIGLSRTILAGDRSGAPPGDLLIPVQYLLVALRDTLRAYVAGLSRLQSAILARLHMPRMPRMPDLPDDHPVTAGISIVLLITVLLAIFALR